MNYKHWKLFRPLFESLIRGDILLQQLQTIFKKPGVNVLKRCQSKIAAMFRYRVFVFRSANFEQLQSEV